MTTTKTKRLLFTREQTAELLGGCSIATVRRLERNGSLHPVRLTRATGRVFFKRDDVLALIDAAVEDAKPRVRRQSSGPR